LKNSIFHLMYLIIFYRVALCLGIFFKGFEQSSTLVAYNMLWEDTDINISTIAVKERQVALEKHPTQGPLVKMHTGYLSPDVYLYYHAADIISGSVTVNDEITIE